MVDGESQMERPDGGRQGQDQNEDGAAEGESERQGGRRQGQARGQDRTAEGQSEARVQALNDEKTDPSGPFFCDLYRVTFTSLEYVPQAPPTYSHTRT